MTEQLIILIEIILIDLVLAGDNAIIIGMVASKFEDSNRKKIIFWGIGGGLMANTQPDVKFDFPHLHFLLFFISHGLMWLGIGFISIGLNNRPTLKSITDVLKVTFPVLFLIYLVNLIINFFAEGNPANYWFMMQRPAGQSIVDLMPDPPFHYIFFIILGVLMFYIIYFPFYVRDKLRR